MKIKMKDALDIHNVLSHIFLECTPRKILEKIAEEKMKLSKEEQDDYTIQLDVLINGHKINPEKFFKMMEDQYEGIVKKEATKIAKNQLGMCPLLKRITARQAPACKEMLEKLRRISRIREVLKEIRNK